MWWKGWIFQRSRARTRTCQRRRADKARVQDQEWARRLRTTQANGGAGVRHHQVGDEVPPIPAARAGAREPRMDAGVPGVELQTHGHAAPEIRREGLKRPENRSFRRKWRLKILFMHRGSAFLLPDLQNRIVSTSSPTGC